MNDPWVFWRLEIDCCAGETIYEWDQTLEEVNLYISLPDRLPSRLLYCTIKPQHVELGVKGNPPYLNVKSLYLSGFFFPLESLCVLSFCTSLVARVLLLLLRFSLQGPSQRYLAADTLLTYSFVVEISSAINLCDS
jgi:hypothetical protein